MKNERMATFQERLIAGMKMRGLRQIDLVNKTGISEASMSHYVRGRCEASQPAVDALSRALNVNVAWLMGYDVPPTRDIESYEQQKELRIALFGGDSEVTDEMWNEVKAFAEYVKAKHKNDNI